MEGVTIEISMYPLQSDYEAMILDFIGRLKKHAGITVYTNAMSTYVQGDFEAVWTILGKEFERSFKEGTPVANVVKIIPRTLPLNAGWLTF